MAWATPPTHSHGDNFTAANLNKFSDNQTALDALLSPSKHYAQPYQALGTGIYANDLEYAKICFVHKHRWLKYLSLQDTDSNYVEVTLYDLTGSNDPVSLPAASTMYVADLRSVGWLHVGRRYYLTAAAYALEDWDA